MPDRNEATTQRELIDLDQAQFDIPVLPPSPPTTLPVVHKHEQVRAQQREAERQAEHLFQALLYWAFRGEV